MAKSDTKTQDKTVEQPVVPDAQTGELTLQQRNALATQEGEIDFSEDAGAGLENTNKDDYALPMLMILQGLSPQVVDATVEGARPGLIFNNINNSLSEDIVVIPVAYQRRFIEWAPRSAGGGYRGEHMPLDVESGKIGEEYVDQNGVKRLGIVREIVKDGQKQNIRHELKDTRTHYVLVVREDGSFVPAVIAMGGTQIKKSKRWLSLIQEAKDRNAAGALFTPPSFSRMYQAFAVKESNDRGTWFGWSIGSLGKVKSRELYEAAKAFHKQVSAGEVQVRHDDVVDVDAEQTQEGDRRSF